MTCDPAVRAWSWGRGTTTYHRHSSIRYTLTHHICTAVPAASYLFQRHSKSRICCPFSVLNRAALGHGARPEAMDAHIHGSPSAFFRMDPHPLGIPAACVQMHTTRNGRRRFARTAQRLLTRLARSSPHRDSPYHILFCDVACIDDALTQHKERSTCLATPRCTPPTIRCWPESYNSGQERPRRNGLVGLAPCVRPPFTLPAILARTTHTWPTLTQFHDTNSGPPLPRTWDWRGEAGHGVPRCHSPP